MGQAGQWGPLSSRTGLRNKRGGAVAATEMENRSAAMFITLMVVVAVLLAAVLVFDGRVFVF